jgi:predicted component of type VI protein secretion system
MKSNAEVREEKEERLLTFAANVVDGLARLTRNEALRVVVYQLSKPVASVGADYQRRCGSPPSVCFNCLTLFQLPDNSL